MKTTIHRKMSRESVYCPITDRLLGYGWPDEPPDQPIEPYGVCVECEFPVYESALHTHNGFAPAGYVVVYEGLYCKDCWAGPVAADFREQEEMQAIKGQL